MLVLITVITVVPCKLSEIGFSSAAAEEVGERVNISSVNDLKKLANNLNAHAVLQKDLEISSSSWIPIGSRNAPFTGVFDGNGHTITLDLRFNKGSETGVEAGLFGCVSGSVKRLTVEGKLKVKVGSGNVGAIAGMLINGGKIFNCYSGVDIDVDSSMSSGIGAMAGTVVKSSAYASYDGQVIRCENYGRINAKVTDKGVSDSSSLSRGTTGALGGIVGFVADTASLNIQKCINKGGITVDGGKYNVGGIVGQTSTDSATSAVYITECANKGDITVTNLVGERAAGIIAYVKSGNIDYCYNTGNIIAYSDSGKTVSKNGYGTYYGIFGYANLGASNKLSVQYCYNASENELEAEICTVRNPSYATFKNYCMEGRDEYETALNSNASAGKKGETFKDAADLTAKLTAATAKYIPGDNQGYPLLSWERDSVLSSENEFELYVATREREEEFDLRFLIHTTDNHFGANLEIVFTLANGKTKTASGNFGEQIASHKKIYADNAAYVPADGYKIFALTLTGIDYGEWTVADIKIASSKGTYLTKQLKYSDIFKESEPSEVPVGDLPDFPEGAVSAVYNAGPGLANDKSSSTADDSRMVVISGVKASSFDSYVDTLDSNGYTRNYFNRIEDNLYYGYAKDGKNYYIYYTAPSKEVRIILDNSSNALISDINGSAQNNTLAETYQYAIDYTKGTGQTSGRDYWAIDCGMCYVIKLPDNSVFMIDGGHERQTSVSAMEALDQFLHEITDTPIDEKVTVTGWFFSHAHGDHVYLSHRFLETYHEKYDLKAVYMNVPSYQTMSGGYDGGTFLMKDTINKYYPDATDIKLHTGQVFSLQGVKLEVLFTHEDAVNPVSGTSKISNFNDSSTVIRTTINGKTVMYLGDIDSVAEGVICNMFSPKTLKSDAVQLSHHCFNNLPNLYPDIAATLLLCSNSVENANGNNAKRQVAITAAGAGYQGILYAGTATYKLTFGGAKIEYEKIAPYWEGFFVTFPTALNSFSGAQISENPLNDSVLSGMNEVSSLVYDKSATGTMGAKADEAPQTLFDGSTSTKWCVTTSATSHVMWKTKDSVAISAYSLYTGNDTATHTGRNPQCWTLYGSADGESWSVIDAVFNGNMKTANFTANTYKVDSPEAYQYYVLVVHNTVDNGTKMQISEIKLYE